MDNESSGAGTNVAIKDASTKRSAVASESAVSRRSQLPKIVSSFLPALAAVLLYVANNLGVIHAWLAAPRGYVAFGLPRDMDVAQYLTWINGLQHHWLLPNFHAPWSTTPGLFVPGLYPVALLKRLGFNAVTAFHIFNLSAYICTAYAIAFALRTFCKDRAQALWAVLIALACVPIASLPGIAGALGAVPHATEVFGNSFGLVEFSTVSDGFLHGLTTWPLITFGTCLLVLGIAVLAHYSDSRDARWLNRFALICFLSALIHPFEVFVLLAVAAIVLPRERGAIRDTASHLLLVFIAAFIGLLPYIVTSRAIPWVQEVTTANRPLMSVSPARLFAALGLPVVVVLILLLLGIPKRSLPGNLVLKTWFVVSFVVFYLPGMPFQLHMLDGLFFCAGLLLAAQLRELNQRFTLPRAATLAAAGIVFAWMLSPHVVFRIHAWDDGISVTNGEKPAFDSAVAPADESNIISWLRQSADPNDLILADAAEAPWMATVPMHSFNSHRLFSLQETRAGDQLWQNAFYQGTLTPPAAQRFLEILGARFVLVPNASPATRYLDGAVQRARLDTYSIYEFPGHHMRPYRDPNIVELGTGTIH